MKTTSECRVEYIDHMGTDLTVVNAARVSFDKESEWENIEGPEDGRSKVLSQKDSKLIKYLAKHDHYTPFTHCMVTLRETVPIFVARQRFKHVVGFSYNEVSRRYVDDEPEFFIPDEWRARPEGSIKQGSGTESLPTPDFFEGVVSKANKLYNDMVESGYSPEQARMVLPQSMMTSYYVTGSLAAWARAYKLRSEETAQKEIQDLAAKWNEIIGPLFPNSWRALCEF